MRPGRGVEAAYLHIREHVRPLGRDRTLHRDLEAVERLIRTGSLLAAVEADPFAAGVGVIDARDLPSLPGYTVFGEIGRGGGGIVYREPTRVSLDRPVAFKVFRLADRRPGRRGRFRSRGRGRRPIAPPDIGDVHDAGTADGRPYS